MAHAAQQIFISRVKRDFNKYFSSGRVLEIGSLDINGSVRALFDTPDYIGLDVAAGPGVDVVCQGQDYDAPDASFDMVISCEAMEHNPFWAQTMRNMVRLCKPGGMVLMSCATTGRPEHGTARTSPEASPLTVGLGWNYYRNLVAADFVAAGCLDGLNHVFMTHWASRDLYLIGIKGEVDAASRARLEAIRRHYRRANWTSWKALRRAAKAWLLGGRRGGRPAGVSPSSAAAGR